MPSLQLEDIPKEGSRVPTEIVQIQGVDVLQARAVNQRCAVRSGRPGHALGACRPAAPGAPLLQVTARP